MVYPKITVGQGSKTRRKLYKFTLKSAFFACDRWAVFIEINMQMGWHSISYNAS
jgi:hypothetical protein